MDNNLEQLKKNFNKIKDIRHKISLIFNTLEVHMKKLKETYSNFIKTNKENIFIFGLDSLHFQSKLIDIEYDDMKRIFLAINNRIYCEYYKLYKIIVDYVKSTINEKKALDLIKLNSNFPIYKDLEPYKNFGFDIVQEIHEHIILILYAINEYIENRELHLIEYKRQQEIGLNINNFVVTFKFGINSMREKSDLFIYYIEFFHGLHTKYLKRFAMKMNLFFSQITNDIRFEDVPTTSNMKKNEIIDEIKQENIDDNLLCQLTNIVQGNESDDSLSINKEGNALDIDNEHNTDKNSSYYSLESLAKSRSSNFSELKNNFKKIINNLSISNKGKNKDKPINFTQMDDNRLKLNTIEKPTLFVETQEKNIISSKNELIVNLSEEDANELTETLNKLPIFEDLNNECNALISPTNSNLNLIKKLQDLENFENKMSEIKKETVSASMKKEENSDKDSVSNITMESFNNLIIAENILETTNKEEESKNNTNNSSSTISKKKKKKNKKKK